MKRLLISAIIFLFAVNLFGQETHSGLKLNGLKKSVTVSRDNRGIPYIEAQNEDDLYFAQGYVMASDRLWQMDLMRRVHREKLPRFSGN